LSKLTFWVRFLICISLGAYALMGDKEAARN